MKRLNKLYVFRNKFVMPYVRVLLSWADGMLYFMSLVFLIAIVYKYGFLLTNNDLEVIERICHGVWIAFLLVNTLHLLIDFPEIRKNYRGITWVLNFLLYLRFSCDYDIVRYYQFFALFKLFVPCRIHSSSYPNSSAINLARECAMVSGRFFDLPVSRYT